jgi:hypothetical protein
MDRRTATRWFVARLRAERDGDHLSLSATLALRGSFKGEENVVEAHAAMVATMNTLIISNAQNQVYADDHSFKFMQEDPAEVRSGSTLVQDRRFLKAGKKPEEGKVVALRTK